jgi:hypothetical protein
MKVALICLLLVAVAYGRFPRYYEFDDLPNDLAERYDDWENIPVRIGDKEFSFGSIWSGIKSVAKKALPIVKAVAPVALGAMGKKK